MKLAIIRNGVVENVILWGDEEFIAEDGYVAVPTEEAGPGWTFDESNFAPPIGESPVVL